MDAKPQRPRGLRVHNENAVQGLPAGKTLHHRTKSTPAFSALLHGGGIKATAAAAAAAAISNGTKKILGEVTVNKKVKPLAKDDSELGLETPEKKAFHAQVKKAAPVPAPVLARPATRYHVAKTALNPTDVTSGKPASASSIRGSGAEVAKPVDAAKKAFVVLPDVGEEEESAAVVVVADTANPAECVEPVHSEVQAAVPVCEAVEHVPQQEVNVETTMGLRVHGDDDAAVAAAAAAPQAATTTTGTVQYPIGNTTTHIFADLTTSATTHTLFPRHSARAKAELSDAKAYVDATRTPDDLEDEAWDTSMVAEYGDEIFAFMREKEIAMLPNANYMSCQTELQWSMRAVLLDWVVQVHERFALLPETLFLTVNFIDRFLSCKIVSIGKLQLVGATAIFIAAKYEEVQCPTVDEIVYMVDGGYSADELIKAERFMLSMLQFELGWPGPMSFLRRISKGDDYDLETRTLAKYFLEVGMMDERFVAVPPSFLAAGAHCMARLATHESPDESSAWTKPHVHYSGYTFTQLKPLLKALWEGCVHPRKHHNAVYHKYTNLRYKRASTFVERKMLEGFRPSFDLADSFDTMSVQAPADLWTGMGFGLI